MTDTAVRAGQTTSAHPLDPAAAAEYLAGREIMAAAGLLAEPVRFAYYGLEEPPKDDVLAGRPNDRRLRAFLVNTATGDSTDVVVSLKGRQVVSARTLDPPADGDRSGIEKRRGVVGPSLLPGAGIMPSLERRKGAQDARRESHDRVRRLYR
jgi:primary-amine oxidase